MARIQITPLHCEDCAADLVKRLELATGRQGFRYDDQHNSLTIPEGVPNDPLEHVLNADKIYILNEHVHDDHAQSGPAHDKREMEQPHSHSPHHKHSHSHDHSLKNLSSQKNILLVFFLNLGFSIIEFIAGIMLNSTSIFSDAIHDLGDAMSVGLAWIFEKISMGHSNRKYTFGHRRFSLLGALITGVFLILGSLFALSRAIPRLFDPQEVNYSGMLYLSIAAILMNGVAAWLLHGRTSKNESILTLHMLEDLLGWVGILIISIILHFKPWYILDPIVSILISLYILKMAFSQTMDTVKILLESVPQDVDVQELAQDILALEGVHGLSHLHFWSMDGEENNFAVTLFTEKGDPKAQLRIRREVQGLVAPLGVNCATIEIDHDPQGLIRGIH